MEGGRVHRCGGGVFCDRRIETSQGILCGVTGRWLGNVILSDQFGQVRHHVSSIALPDDVTEDTHPQEHGPPTPTMSLVSSGGSSSGSEVGGKDYDGIRDDVKSMLRRLFDGGRGLKSVANVDLHVDVYAQELIRLRRFYTKGTSTSYVLAFMYLQLDGWKFGGTQVIPKDELLGKLLPNMSSIEALSFHRSDYTIGAKHVREKIESLCRKQTRDFVIKPIAAQPIDAAYLVRPHAELFQEALHRQREGESCMYKRRRIVVGGGVAPSSSNEALFRL
jgi:hypothetical protein